MKQLIRLILEYDGQTWFLKNDLTDEIVEFPNLERALDAIRIYYESK